MPSRETIREETTVVLREFNDVKGIIQSTMEYEM